MTTFQNAAGRTNDVAPIDAEARARVDAAVARAEGSTSAEIVAGLARRSGSYRHVHYVAGLLGALVALSAYSVGWWLWKRTWPVAPVDVFLGVGAVGYVVAALIARGEGAARFLAGSDAMFEACDRRATELFLSQGVVKTKERNGVLLYVSLFERVVIVRGDEAIAAKLPHDVWRETVEAMIGRLKGGDVEGALIEGVERLGRLLKAEFPRAADDVNELPDRLVVV